MHGVLNLLKPPGMTSHDAVAFVRRTLGLKRVGHTGTLDPAACGVLPICVGQATRLVEYLQAGSKEYIAEATFGIETDTLDAAGKIISRSDANGVTLERLRAVLDEFRGEIEQVPPLYSAVKQDGKKLYELARAGEETEIKTRRVRIDGLFVTRFIEGEQPRAFLKITCGGGTYIRSLVRDIGQKLGCGATMTFLVRSRSGAFELNNARPPEEVASEADAALIPMLEVLSWCAPHVVTNNEATHALLQGRQVPKAAPDLQEYKADSDAFKLRRTRVMHNGADAPRVLFRTFDGTIAAFASPAENDEKLYKAEKVFDLRA